MPRLFFALLLLPLLASFSSAQQGQPTATAEVSPAKTSVGQMVNYFITIQGGQLTQEPALNFPPNLNNVGLTANQSSVSIVNGVATVSTQLGWGLASQTPGEYVIPQQQLVIDGKQVTVNEVKLTVTAVQDAPSSQIADGQGEHDPILTISLGKTQFYIGEIVPVTAVLYMPRSISLQRLGIIDASASTGFAIQRFPQQPEQSLQRLGDRTYTALTSRSTLSALKPGDLKLGPAKCELLLGIPMRSGGSRGPFGFGFQQMQQEKRTVMSNDIAVKVLPLPTAGKPKNFSGAVGDFSITASSSDTSVTVGQPVNVEITISGQGNFDAIQPPVLSEPAGWKAYPPRRYDMNSGDSNTRDMFNRRIGFSAILVPEKVMPAVPSFEFSFFNPTTAQYTTLRSEALPLTIAPGAAPAANVAAPGAGGSATAQGPAVMGGDLAPQAQLSDILLHLPASPRWAVAALPPLKQSGFKAFNAVFLLALIGLVAWVLSRRAAEARARSAERRRQALLSEVEAATDDPAEFYRRAARYVHSIAPEAEATPELQGIFQRYESLNFAGPIVREASPGLSVSAQQSDRLKPVVTGAPAAPNSDQAAVLAALRELKPGRFAKPDPRRLVAAASPLTALLLLLLATLLLPSPVMASPSPTASVLPGDATERYAAVVKALETKDFKAAERTATDLIASGAVGPELFELLGHARYRQGDQGGAALWYQRARLFPGSQPEVRQNLRHLSERTHFFAPSRDELLDTFTRQLSTTGWAYLASAGLWLVLFGVAGLLLFRQSAMTRYAVAALILGLLIGSAALLGWRLRPGFAEVADLCCVTSAKAQARTAATTTSGSVIAVPPGSVIQRISERGAWSYIEIPQPGESLRGWMETEALQPLWPYDPALLP